LHVQTCPQFQVPEAGVHGVLHRGFQVGVVEDDERRLAAELQRYGDDVLSGRCQDLAPAPHRAGHRDHRRDRMAYQRIAYDPPRPRDDVDDPRRDPGLLDDPRQRERRERGLFVWLENDGVARRDVRGDLVGKQRRRIVPGDDADHDAVGDVPDHQYSFVASGANMAPIWAHSNVA
jgi:hypothetical protein